MRFPGHGREPPRQPFDPMDRFGGHSEGETPGPIPNPEVKPFSADGTALETVWESRTPPDINIYQERPAKSMAGLSCFSETFAFCGTEGRDALANRRPSAPPAMACGERLRCRTGLFGQGRCQLP